MRGRRECVQDLIERMFLDDIDGLRRMVRRLPDGAELLAYMPAREAPPIRQIDILVSQLEHRGGLDGDLLAAILDARPARAVEVVDVSAELNIDLVPSGLEAMLIDPRQPLGDAPLPSELLRAETRTVEWLGPPHILEDLVAWGRQPGIGVRLLTAPGGFGKSRTALEWVARLRAESTCAGFLARGIPVEDVELVVAGRGIRCVVIDYAETTVEVVEALLAAAHTRRGVSLRLLLLARQAGEWWRDLGADDARLRALLDRVSDTHEVVALPLTSRAQMFMAARRAFAHRLRIPQPSDDLRVPEGPLFDRPLYVQMAAMVSLHGEVPDTEDALLDAVYEHERRFHVRALDRLPLPRTRRSAAKLLLNRMLPLLVLWGGASHREALLDAMAAVAPNAMDHAPVASTLEQLYGDRRHRIAGIEPDLLGEHIVRRGLAVAPWMVDHTFDGEHPHHHALTVLTRLATRIPTEVRWLVRALADRLVRHGPLAMRVAAESGGPLGSLLATLLARTHNRELARDLLERTPFETLELRELALEAATLVASADPTPRDLQLLAYRLDQMGRDTEAVHVARSAVEHLIEYPEDVEALVRAETSLANRLGSAGHHAEAMAVASSAFTHCDASIPDELRAGVHHCLANRNAAVGRPEVALEHAMEALEIRRSNLDDSSEARDRLASALGAAARHQGELGRLDAAISAAQEALSHRKPSAKLQGDVLVVR